jgi:hypothetical protein
MNVYSLHYQARSLLVALREFRSGRGTKHDANVVDVMLQIIEGVEFDFGWRVEA